MFGGLVKIIRKAVGRFKRRAATRKIRAKNALPNRGKKARKNAQIQAQNQPALLEDQRLLPSVPAIGADLALKNFASVQLSRHTKRAYERDLKEFYFYLKKEALFTSWQLLGPSEIAAYRDDLISRKFAKATVTRKLAVLKSFYSWTVAQGFMLRNPADTVRSFPQTQDSTTGFLTEEQVYQLLNYLDRLDTEGRLSKHLAKVGISILLMLGVRRSEACQLKFEDLSMSGDTWIIRVQGKGGRDRNLPLAPLLMEVLEDWFRRIHIEECPAISMQEAPAAWLDFLKRRSDQPLLISTKATTFTKQLSDGELARIVRKHCLKAGIPFRVSPHMLRSTAITHALDQGATHRGIQQMAGWTSPLMISRYDKKRMDPKYSAVHQLRYARHRTATTPTLVKENAETEGIEPTPYFSEFPMHD